MGAVLQMLPKGCPEKEEPNAGQHLYKEVASKKLQEPPSSGSVYLNTASEKKEPNAGQHLYRRFASKTLQEPPSSSSRVYLNTASK